MRSQKLLGRWLIAPALFLAFCSKGNSPSMTGPSIEPATVVAGADTRSLGISATGDVKVGTGALEFLNLAIWGFNGDPGAGGYVNPGGTYGITPGVEVKLWATYVEGSPANPKFMVDWGDGSEPSAGGCGACKATHRYATPGLYTVKASLDDRVSTMVTRTFELDARPIATSRSTNPCANYGGTRVEINDHIVVCQTPVAWGGWDNTLVGEGWNVCNLRQWEAYAPGRSPASYGLQTIWIDNNSCGATSHHEVYVSYPMNQKSCYDGSSCCWNDSTVLQFAVCNG